MHPFKPTPVLPETTLLALQWERLVARAERSATNPPTSTNPAPATPPPTNGGGGGGDCTAYGARAPCESAGCSWSGKDKACS